jgi:hypothetical protein
MILAISRVVRAVVPLGRRTISPSNDKTFDVSWQEGERPFGIASVPAQAIGVSRGVLTAVAPAWADPTGGVIVTGVAFAGVGVGVVPVWGGAVGVRAGLVGVRAAVVAETEWAAVAVLAVAGIGVSGLDVPRGVAAGVSPGIALAVVAAVPFGVTVTVPPGAGLPNGVPFGVAVTVLAGVGLVRIAGIVIGAEPGASWRSAPTVVPPCLGAVLPTSAATGRRATTSTAVMAPIARTKTSPVAPTTRPQRIGRRTRCGEMTTRSIAPVCGLKRVWMRARARWSEWL